jgi:hypothetical protein
VPPLVDGQNGQRVIFQQMCMHAGSPIPQNTCFIFQKRSESGPCEKTTLTKTEVALLGVLGPFFWPISGFQKSREPTECRKEGEGVTTRKFHVFSFFSKNACFSIPDRHRVAKAASET